MTEEKWTTGTHPSLLLKCIRRKVLTDRKFRLFAVACARRVWALIANSGQNAIEVAEGYADGVVTLTELRTAQLRAIRDTTEDDEITSLEVYRANQALFAAINVAGERQQSLKGATECTVDAVADAAGELAAQCMILRDIVGNPFRKGPKLKKAWRTDTVLSLAKQMYEVREFGAMPILADALQDAGCENADILDHCHGPGPHVRGCWVVDLILGKE